VAVKPYRVIRRLTDRDTRDEIADFVKAFNEVVSAISPSGSSPVTSFNGRVGAVVPVQADYDGWFTTTAEVNTILAGYVPNSRTITAGTGLTGGGDLSANRTIAVTGNLATLYALADASGFLQNNGAGVLSYAQPDAGNLAGTTLKSTVVTSSLTSLGTLTSLTMGGVILAADGAVGAPAYSFGSDSDTGFYWVTSGQINIGLNGTNYFRFTTSGFRFGQSGTQTFLDNNGNELLKFTTTPAAVPYVNITNATTGNAPKIEAAGETNLDLFLGGAGTGVLQFGTHSAIGAETVTGFITIKDSGGTTRKLAVVS
jgi:hypothetical protein